MNSTEKRKIENKEQNFSQIKFGKEFIFFNPFDENLTEYAKKKIEDLSKKEKENNEYHNKLKERAFSSEAKDLIGSLTSQKDKQEKVHYLNDENLIERIKDFETRFKDIRVSPFLSFLNEAYFDNITEKELISIFRYFTHSTRIYSRSFAVMKYDRFLGAYKVMTAANLSEEDKNNFYLLRRDSLFHLRKDRITFLVVTEEMKKNRYFSKRFSPNKLKHLRSMLIIPMHRLHVLSYLVFFYHTSKGEELYPHLDQQLIQARLTELSPSLKSFIHEETEVQINQVFKELRKDLQTVSNMGDKKVLILKIFPKDPITNKQYLKMKKNLETELGYNDRFILIHARLIYVIIEKSDPQYVLSLLRKTVPDFKLETRNFPDFGYNYYSYL